MFLGNRTQRGNNSQLRGIFNNFSEEAKAAFKESKHGPKNNSATSIPTQKQQQRRPQHMQTNKQQRKQHNDIHEQPHRQTNARKGFGGSNSRHGKPQQHSFATITETANDNDNGTDVHTTPQDTPSPRRKLADALMAVSEEMCMDDGLSRDGEPESMSHELTTTHRRYRRIVSALNRIDRIHTTNELVEIVVFTDDVDNDDDDAASSVSHSSSIEADRLLEKFEDDNRLKSIRKCLAWLQVSDIGSD